MILDGVSSEKIVAHLYELRRRELGLLVEFLWYLSEVERRRVHLEMGFSSTFVFCTDHLGMTKSAAFRRTKGAELLSRFPLAGEYLADGRLCLSAFVLLRDVLEGDGRVVLDRAVGKSEDDVKVLVAAMKPQEDPGELFRRLPNVNHVQVPAEPPVDKSRIVNHVQVPAEPPVDKSRRDRVEPISEDRRVLRMTVGQEFADDLAKVKAALSHQIPDGSLEKVLHACLKEMLVTVEKRRKGTGKGRDGSTTGRYVPVEVRRAVWERDGDRCAFVSNTGRRCGSTYQLELHHIDPFGKGGSTTVENLKVLCRQHNAFHAERDYP